MNTLFALALSTPIWGFALQPPVAAAPAIAPELAAQVRTTTTVHEYEVLPPGTYDLEADARNETWMDWTRALTVATTVAMAYTGVMGFIQFHDEYGFHDDYYDTACAQQRAILQDYCGEQTPVPHAIGAAASATGLLSSVLVSTQVDFDRAARRDGDWRTYEVTRWVALGLGLAQATAGILLANAQRWDYADYRTDFDTMQGFAIAHMALGAANLGMNLANSILLF